MNDTVAPLTDAPAPAVIGAGARLRAAREAQGLAAADIARHLRLSAHQVEALETDAHDKLPGPVFVRGFLRNYARLVKLDPEVVVASQPSLAPPPFAIPDVPPAVGAPFSAAPNLSWLRYAVIGIALLAPLGLYLALDDGPETAPLAVAPPLATAPAESGQGGGAAVRNGDAPAVPAETVATAAVPAAATPVVVPLPRKAGDHVIQLQFERESWVEVRDSEGRKLYSQLNAAGSSQTINGAPPLTLIIGNAAGVRMTVNDRPYDLAPYVKVDVARLTLD